LLVEATRDGLWWEPPSLFGDGSTAVGGGGARQVTMIALPDAAKAVRPEVKVSPPAPVPVIAPERIVPPVPSPVIDTVVKPIDGATTPGSGGGTGGGRGPGAGPGTGPGSGAGTGGSGAPAPIDSTRIVGRPPEPRQLVLPPFDYPRAMRGRTIAVTFFVLVDGRVDRVVFSEEIPDRGYARKLEDTMRSYRFRPARSPAGDPVAGVTTVSISF
jgi:outer membrane biosynthesis protein TonB